MIHHQDVRELRKKNEMLQTKLRNKKRERGKEELHANQEDKKENKRKYKKKNIKIPQIPKKKYNYQMKKAITQLMKWFCNQEIKN